MAITRDGTGATKILWEAVGNVDQVITFTTTANRHLVVTGAQIPTTPTLTDSGSGTWVVKVNASGTERPWIAYSENRAAITSVTIALGGAGPNYGGAKLDQYAGVATTGSFELQTTATGTVGSATFGSGNHTTVSPNALIVGAAIADDTTTTAWTTTLGSFTELAQDGNSGSSLPWQTIFQIAAGSTGPYSITWNYPPMAGSGFSGQSLLVSFAPATNTPLMGASIWMTA